MMIISVVKVLMVLFVASGVARAIKIIIKAVKAEQQRKADAERRHNELVEIVKNETPEKLKSNAAKIQMMQEVVAEMESKGQECNFQKSLLENALQTEREKEEIRNSLIA